MTTREAADRYLADHQASLGNRGWAVYNPNNRPVEELPFIYGFNNSANQRGGMLSAVLIAEDGTGLGGHCCSHEGYMESDLGVLEGTRPDRHETFRKHYPDGYRMAFVGHREVLTHTGLEAAYQRNQQKAKEAGR